MQNDMELISSQIQESELVLVGIGERFAQGEAAEKVKRAYQTLSGLLEGKNYFIVTTCVDELIYEVGLKEDRVVRPLAEEEMQQEETDDIGQAGEAVRADKLAREEMPTQTDKPMQTELLTPADKQVQTEHTVRPSRWAAYMKWLQGTLNRRLLVLELGVGLQYPGIIRFPFEKTVYFNQKASLIRVHDRLFQLPAELSGRGTAIREDAVAMLAGYEKA